MAKKQKTHILYNYNSQVAVRCERANWKTCPEHKHLTNKRPKKVPVFFNPEANLKMAKKYSFISPVTKIGLLTAAGLNALLIPSATGLAGFVSVASAFLFDGMTKAIKKPLTKFLAAKNASSYRISQIGRRYKLATIVGSTGLSFTLTAVTGVGGVTAIFAGAASAIVSLVFISVTDRVAKKYNDETFEKTTFSHAELKFNAWLDKQISKAQKSTNGKLNRASLIVTLLVGKELADTLFSGGFDLKDVASTADSLKNGLEDNILDNKKI